MITTPIDPVQELIDKASFWSRELALTLMDDRPIIMPGMNIPNKIVTTQLEFERLPSEPDTLSPEFIAGQLSRLAKRTYKQLGPWLLSRKLRQMGRAKNRRV